MTGIEIFAKFVQDTNYGHFDKETVTYAKSLCLSGLGMTVRGSRLPAGKVTAAYAKEAGDRQEAGVIGAGFRTSSEKAALVNATASHTTELEDDDMEDGACTMTVWPTAVALGEKLKRSGKEVLEGFILGYEVHSWIGTACGAPMRGWIVAMHAGSLGSAACAAKMMGLNQYQTEMAIASAASQGGGLWRTMGTMGHFYEAGVACRNGICAAMLAKNGLTGNVSILDGARGLCDSLTGRGDFDFGALGNKLGRPFRVMLVGIKKYPCCYILQRIIDGVLELIDEHKISADDVESVDVEVNPLFPVLIQFPEPVSPEQSRFSVSHVVAAMMAEKKISEITFTDAKITDPEIARHRKKVRVTVHNEWESGFMAGVNPVTFKLKDGREFKKVCDKLKGHPPYLLTVDEVMMKYKECVKGILGEKEAEKVGEMIMDLDKLNDLSELMSLLTFPKGG